LRLSFICPESQRSRLIRGDAANENGLLS